MKTSSLTGAELDYLIGKIEGKDMRCGGCHWPLKDRMEDGCIVGSCSQRPIIYPEDIEDIIVDGSKYSPSEFPNDAWDVIDKWPHVVFSEDGDIKGCGLARQQLPHKRYYEEYYGEGPTKLIAAMRAIVASVYGDSVDEN